MNAGLRSRRFTRGVTHAVVHLDRIDATARAAIDASESLTPIADDGTVRVYRLR